MLCLGGLNIGYQLVEMSAVFSLTEEVISNPVKVFQFIIVNEHPVVLRAVINYVFKRSAIAKRICICSDCCNSCGNYDSFKHFTAVKCIALDFFNTFGKNYGFEILIV